MRRIALLAALCLLAGACGDDATTTSSSSSTAPPTTTTALPTATTATSLTQPTTTATSTTPGETSTTGTTYAWATFDVPEADLCVVEHRSGETLNVRSGPGTTYDVVGSSLLRPDRGACHRGGRRRRRPGVEGDRLLRGPGVGGFVAAHPESLRPGRAGRLLRDRHLVPGAHERPLRPRRCLPEAGKPPLRHGGRPGHRGLLRRRRRPHLAADPLPRRGGLGGLVAPRRLPLLPVGGQSLRPSLRRAPAPGV